jgi:glucose/arabinose dehydrogenase
MTLAPAAATALIAAALASTTTAARPPQDAPPANTVPGLTLWAWRLDGQLPRWPRVDDGQTPNAYRVVTSVAAIRDPIAADDGPLADRFAGEMRGWLRIDAPGRHMFRMVGDDGARLVIDGRELYDTERLAGFVGEDGLDLAAGLHSIRIPFYEDSGKFLVSLQWMPPGQVGYSNIPADNLRTEAGQTFATSPGTKRWRFAEDARRPGDGLPLVAPHPAFRLEKVRTPDFKPQVGALCFLPDGRLAVAEWQRDGKVWILSNMRGQDTAEEPNASNPTGDDQRSGTTSGCARPHLLAEGLSEPLGLAWVDGALVVTQRGEVTRLVDESADGFYDCADRYETLAFGWPQSANYHEFTFNLVPIGGRLYFTTSVPLRGGLTNYVPGTDGDFSVPDGPGSLWSIARSGGDLRREGRGLRTPNGMGRGPQGDLFVCDNQGSWMPASRLNQLKIGAPSGSPLPHYGHQERRGGTEQSKPPVAWFPHGEIGNSPSEPVLVHDGPHRGQLYVGDVTYGGVTRVFVERIPHADGIARWQGCAVPMSQGIEAGVNRMAWCPQDGALYLGGVGSNGNWNHQGHTFGLERLVPTWNGHAGPDAARAAAFEMLRVQSVPSGFLVTMSAPANAHAAESTAWDVRSWRYEPTEQYGGPKVDPRSHAVTRVAASPDSTQFNLDIADLSPGRVYAITMRGIASADGRDPWSTNAWYTLNAISGTDLPFERFVGSPVPPTDAIWLWDGPAMHGTAWQMKKDGSPCNWVYAADGSLCATVPPSGIGDLDIVSRKSFGDCFVHLEWLSPPGGSAKDGQRNGNSGIKLMERYELQVMNTPGAPEPARFNEAGAVYRQRAADANASTGAGTWQSYDVWFTAPRWETSPGAAPRKVANARMTVLWNGVLVHDDVEVKDKTGLSDAEAPGPARILLQSHASDAEGPVRFRNVWVAEGVGIPGRKLR